MRRGSIIVTCFFVALMMFVFSLKGAQIVDMVGKAQVQPASSTSWRSAKVGMAVSIGDKIRTARRSQVMIALDEDGKNIVSVGELTMVILNSTVPGQINKFDLSEGKLYAKVEKVKAGATFEVTTPSAVAGVRGTAWSVNSNSQRDVVAVYESSVFVKAFDEKKNLISEITIPEGFKTIIERFGPPGKLLPLSGEERGSWKKVKKRFRRILKGLKEPDLGNLGDVSGKLGDLQDKLDDIQEQIEDHNIQKTIEERTEEGECEGSPPSPPYEP